MPRKPSPLPEVAVLQSTFLLKDGRITSRPRFDSDPSINLNRCQGHGR